MRAPWRADSYFPVYSSRGAVEPSPPPTKRSTSKRAASTNRSARDSVSYSPFAKAFAAAEFRTAAPSEALGLLVFAGSRLPSNGSPETDPLLPSEEVMKPLVEPEGFGIGYYAPWFWRAAFAYPSSQTRGVLC
jgi:hypothetical protein